MRQPCNGTGQPPALRRRKGFPLAVETKPIIEVRSLLQIDQQTALVRGRAGTESDRDTGDKGHLESERHGPRRVRFKPGGLKHLGKSSKPRVRRLKSSANHLLLRIRHGFTSLRYCKTSR